MMRSIVRPHVLSPGAAEVNARRIRTYAIALAFLATAAVGACVTNPATGEKMFSLVSESQEIEMGRQGDEEVRRTFGYYDDPDLQAYIDSLGQTMAAIAERPHLPWKFKVVEQPVVNAFAYPGGFIFIARGIMTHFNTETELASVLGHEIGHVTARHSAEAISRAQLAQIGLVAGAVFVPEVAQNFGAFSQGLQLMFLSFGRDDEAQSDELGFRYMTKLGYDPQGAVAMFQILERQQASSGGSALPDWASTHPDPGNRIEAAERRIVDSGITSGYVRRNEYLTRIDGLVYGEDPRLGYFEGHRFRHPELAFEFTFPDGWDHVNGADAVLGQSPDRDAAMQVRLVPGGASTAAAEFFGQQSVAGTASRGSVNGLPASSGSFRMQTQEGILSGYALFVDHRELTYALFAFAPEARISTYDAAFKASLGSFAKLTDRAALNVQPRRIEIVTLDRAMTVQAFTDRYPSTVDAQAVALINGMELTERVPAGAMLKRIVGEGAP